MEKYPKRTINREELSRFLRKEIHNYYEGGREATYFKAEWGDIVETLKRKGYKTHGQASFHPIGVITMIFENKEGCELPVTYSFNGDYFTIER